MDDTQLIDKAWGSYESKLATCIKKLASGTIDAMEWAGVIVPFVTGLFVRRPDFDKRFDNRASAFGTTEILRKFSEDNTKMGRAMETQRLLGPILGAKWIVSKAPEQNVLITTDLSFGIFQDPDGQVGVAIPLDGQHILQLIARRTGDVAIAGEAKWYPVLEHRTLLADSYKQLNEALSGCAQRFIFGSNVEKIQSYLQPTGEKVPLLELGEVGFVCGPLAAVHEFAWHRFVSAVNTHPKIVRPDQFDLDWNAIAAAWKPPAVFFPTNLPAFPSPFRREGNIIRVHFYDVEGFPSHERHPGPRMEILAEGGQHVTTER